jgi:tetratricopeptide (TPR) repeat protein
MRILILFCLLLTASTSLQSQNTPPSLANAQVLLQQGKLEDSITMLQQLATASPTVKGVHHALGIAYYRTGKLVDAQKEFAAAMAEDTSDAESIQMEGLTLYRMGQPGKAIEYLQRVRDLMPNADADANHVLGLCYLNDRRYDDARAAFAQQFGVDPASASAYLLLSTMLLQAQLPELAADEARKALQLNPNLPLAHFRLGEVFLFKSDIDHATEEFEEERRLNPAYPPTYDRLGDVYTRAGKYSEAQQALTKAISLDTTSTGPFILMGKVLLHRDDASTAVLYLRHAEKMDPSNYITHTLLAQAYRKSGRQAEAGQELDVASKLHTASEPKLLPLQ